MSQFLAYALPGIPDGCAPAIMAVGLVLTFRATGVFNFAFAGQAYLAGLLYSLLLGHGNSVAVAAVVSIVVVSPLLGLVLDLVLFSRIPRDQLAARVVVSLTVLVLLQEVPSLFSGTTQVFAPTPLLGSPATTAFQLGSVEISTAQLGTFAVAVGAVALVGAVFRWSRLGLEMRASVESTRLLELSGVDAAPVTAAAWMLSSMLAGLAGVLLAPTFNQVTPDGYWVLFVGGITAAVIGGFRSLGWAFIGGLGLGVVIDVSYGYLPDGSTWQSWVAPSVPFFLLGLLVLFHPGIAHLELNDDPLASVDPPREVPIQPVRRNAGAWWVAGVGWAGLAAAGCYVLVAVDPSTMFTLADAMALSTILLSITLVTGLSGQFSLSQAAFAGLGAFTCAQVELRLHWGFFAGALAGAVVAAVAALFVAIPAQRLRGLALMLLTLAFALFCETVLFNVSWIGGGGSVVVPTPVLGPVHFDTGSSRQFFAFGVLLFALAAFAVNRLRQGSTGLFSSALRESEAGAVSVGISPVRVRTTLFVLAGALAGLGGALYGSVQNVISPNEFLVQYSIVWLVAVCAIGAGSIWGALVAGVVLGFATTAPTPASPWTSWGTWLQLGLAAAALSFAWHPQGLLELARQRSAKAIQHLAEARRQLEPKP